MPWQLILARERASHRHQAPRATAVRSRHCQCNTRTPAKRPSTAPYLYPYQHQDSQTHFRTTRRLSTEVNVDDSTDLDPQRPTDKSDNCRTRPRPGPGDVHEHGSFSFGHRPCMYVGSIFCTRASPSQILIVSARLGGQPISPRLSCSLREALILDRTRIALYIMCFTTSHHPRVVQTARTGLKGMGRPCKQLTSYQSAP